MLVANQPGQLESSPTSMVLNLHRYLPIKFDSPKQGVYGTLCTVGDKTSKGD